MLVVFHGLLFALSVLSPSIRSNTNIQTEYAAYVKQEKSTYLLNTINPPILHRPRHPRRPHPSSPPLPHLDPPRQLRAIQIDKQSRRQIPQLDSLIGKAGQLAAEEGGESRQ
jgi:hypothetical protein